jgi:hypothetical protein
MKIDKKLEAGEVSLVEDIINKLPKRFYSFATKYCSFHKPEVFPIYDGRVNKALSYFKKEYGFCEFRKKDLKIYEKFVDILKEFKKKFRLDNYNFKELDKYLWQVGKELMAKK